jgi:hypothetical protein
MKGIKMTMLNKIIKIRKDKSVLWNYGKNKKTVLTEMIAAFDGLCAGREYLENWFIEDLLGVEHEYKTKTCTVGLSINQMKHYIRFVVKTGRLLKRPYTMPNTFEFDND